MADLQLANLVDMESPEAVLGEALTIVGLLAPHADTAAIQSAFGQTVSLYRGEWQGTRGCNTKYHDLKHITDCFLAMIRLMHGAVETGVSLSDRQVHQGLVAALLHDAGYLQNSEDTEGTGAKYTACHVRRGMDFIQRHFEVFGLHDSEVHACMAMIHCTDINCDAALVPFADETGQQLGKMLATADIMAQMADRNYLEKLLYLYCELDEAKINAYGNEVDLLHQSKDFYLRMADRFATQLSSANRFMIHHFRSRWNIDEDLYQRAIDNQRAYLTGVLANADGDPRRQLRRNRTANA
jgi:hypothetical protein